MAFDEVRPQTLQASSRSRHCSSLGASLVATCQRLRGRTEASRSWTRNPPSVWRRLRFDLDGGGRCDHAHVLSLFGKAGKGRLVEGGGDKDVRERAVHDLGPECPVYVPTQGDDPAESSDTVPFERPLVGGGEVVSYRRAAGVGVLDDHRRAKPVSEKLSPCGTDKLVTSCQAASASSRFR